MKAICTKCGQPWDVSIYKNLRVPFVCPHCFSKKKIKKVILLAFGFLISCLLTIKCSEIATLQRGYQTIGGEGLIPIGYIAVIVFIKTITDIKKESTY